MTAPLVADSGGLLRALAARPDGRPSWPEYADALREASAVVVPPLVLAEVDYFLRRERAAMRRLVAEMLDPATTYELEPLLPEDLVRALEIDAKFRRLDLGLVDGSVAAIAERRHIPRVLTTDRRDFTALRIGPRWDRALVPVP
ncbi:MAG TPA: PIN domain-containing protein [Candidatus Binatia bacterium]|nr:PIN domain-containing protein [Candidatus Binatia bacterium]